MSLSTTPLLAFVAVALLAGCSEDAPRGPATGTWTERAPLSLGPRQEMGVAALQGKVYVVGGFDETGAAVATMEAYDPATNGWAQRASLPAPLHHVNVAAVGDLLYVVGALSGSGFGAVGTTLSYDPGTNAWTALTGMLAGTQRGASGVAVVGTRIYVAGGLRAGASVTDFSAFDTVSGSWEPLPSMAVARDHLAAAASDGRVFAISGRDSGALRAAVEMFDPATSLWTPRASIPSARGGIAAAELSGQLVVMGGEGNTADPAGILSSSPCSWRGPLAPNASTAPAPIHATTMSARAP